MRKKVNYTLEEWRNKEITALELLRIVGELRFNRSIELVLFRHNIYDTRPSQLIGLHKYSKNYGNVHLSIDTSHAIAQEISNLTDLPPAKIDIGNLGLEWSRDQALYDNLKVFISKRLSNIIGQDAMNQSQKDIVLYGFGRIGRLVARRIIETTGKGEQLRLRAIVIRPKMEDRLVEAQKRASLFDSDSVHGDFGGNIEVSQDGNELIVNGNRIKLIYAGHPSEVDYTHYEINNALVIDNTGVWRDREGLSQHLRPGIDAVMLTAPAKGDIPNIVHGVNQKSVDYASEKIISAASCTTNAIVPVLQVLEDKYGIHKGHVETIHAYTNDQNLLDNFHKKPRRGRGAPVNMVLTSTGAASAVSKVIPSLAGKLSGNAIRVPTPNVSLAILNLSLTKETDAQRLNELLREASLHGDLVEQITYSTSTEYVSSNAIGMTSACVVDAPSTIVSDDGKSVILYLWYDNEYGYTCQVVRLAKFAAKVRRHAYY